MADWFWLERFETYSSVNEMPIEELLDIAPHAARYLKSKNSSYKD